jgi:hypothetical protein
VSWPNLTDELGPIPWAVIGAVATRMYMRERSTQDLDVMVAAPDAAAVEERLAEAGWVRVGPLTIGGATWRSPAGLEVDILHSRAPWTERALAEAADNRDDQGLPILPLPYLVLTKLAASRAQDVADIARMLGAADESALAAVRGVVRRYAPEDAEDLEALIELGKRELE